MTIDRERYKRQKKRSRKRVDSSRQK